MKKGIAIACCILTLAGCGQSPPSAPASPSTESTSVSDVKSVDDETYQDIALGGYVVKVPSHWIIEDNYIYFDNRESYPVAMSMVLEDYDSLSELFSYSGSEEEFITGVGDEIFDYSPASSEMKSKTYGDVPALTFNMTGTQDGVPLNYVYNMFDNPGGGILIVTLCTDTENMSSALHDYLSMFYDMESSLDSNVSNSESKSVQNSANSSTVFIPFSYDDGSVTSSKEASVEKSAEKEDSEDEYKPTVGERNALSSAKEHLRIMAFSYSGLIHQLEYEGYQNSEATYAADNCGADWNEQAVKSAQEYLDVMSFSRSDLIEQLVHDGFTHDQAEYGVSQVYD